MLDLFAGCGGFSLGLQRAGLVPVAGIEKDVHAVASYARNFHVSVAAHARPRDLTDPELTPESLCAEFDLGPAPLAIDMVVGGPPCQAFARIGRAKLREIAAHPQAYLRDPRADLHAHWLAWIVAFQPLAVMIENVPDMLNLAGRNLAEEIVAELETMGFRCGYTLLNAAHFGVPQMRERLFLFGVHEGLAIEPFFPAPTHRLDLPRGYRSSRDVAMRTLGREGELFRASHWIEPIAPSADLPPAVGTREALADLPKIQPMQDPSLRRGPRRLDRVATYRPGALAPYAEAMRKWPGFEAPTDGPRDHVIRHLPRDWPIFAGMRSGDEYPAALRVSEALFQRALATSKEPIIENSAEWQALRKRMVPPYKADRFPNKWWKLYPDRPSRTLMAHLGKDGYSHIHYDDDQARPISVREAARLQSFPDGFVFEGTMNPAFQQIGNAVPPLMANALGEQCRHIILAAARRRLEAGLTFAA